MVDLGLVGPADLAFMGMFFACLHRFGMRAKATARWLAPVIALYFLLAISPLGSACCRRCCPIGATVVLVNWKTFGLRKRRMVGDRCCGNDLGRSRRFRVYQRINYKPPKELPAEPSSSAPAQGSGAPAELACASLTVSTPW